jgi:hypothetical protein
LRLPPFNRHGLLPEGDYSLTLQELGESFLVTGKGFSSKYWDQEWRATLVDNLSILARPLWDVGVTEICVDGSFVEKKDHPGDIDGYFVCNQDEYESGILQHRLGRFLSPALWNWGEGIKDPDTGKPHIPMWHQYRVELFPCWPSLSSGIPDRRGRRLDWPRGFRQQKETFRPKGVVVLKQT